MNNSFECPIKLRSIALMVVFASISAASTIQFTGAPTGVNDGSFYVLPYQITIDGATQLVACYDTLDDVNTGDTWQANLLTIGEAAESGYFSTGSLAPYERVAWLSAQDYSNTDQQVGLQHAIWNIFGSAPRTTESSIFDAAADTAAASDYANFDFSAFRFIQEAGVVGGQAGVEQAFVYRQSSLIDSINSNVSQAPEPGSLVLFGLGAGLIALGLLKKRQSVI